MMNILSRRFGLLAILGAWTSLQGAAALAAVINWNTNSSGNFSDAGNWTSNVPGTGVPGSQDEASFARGSAETYTVTFPGDLIFNPTRTYTNSQLYVGNNTVTFGESTSHLLGRANYTLTNPTTAQSANRGIVVGEGSADTAATLTTGLNTITSTAVSIGDQGAVGTFNVVGGVVNITGNDAGNTELIVGDFGEGHLNISGGGRVNVAAQNGSVGVGFGNIPTCSISIDGTGSQFNIQGSAGGLLMGLGSLISATAGGKITTASAAADEGTVTIDGAGSSWVAQDIGLEGALNVTGGGTVTAGSVTGQGLLMIDGAGSSVTHGASSDGNVTVTNGGQLNETATTLSRSPATVSGIGSKWTVTGSFQIADNELVSLTNGGQLVTGTAMLNPASNVLDECNITVDGAGTAWANGGYMSVGESRGGDVYVTGGGQVSTAAASLGATSLGGGGVFVAGANSKFTVSGQLTVGGGGNGILDISAGGNVSDTYCFIGSANTSFGRATVDGVGSAWSNSGDLIIGEDGAGSLTITHGGKVTSTHGFVGDDNGGTGTVTVDGTNSTWELAGDLRIGDFGAATLTVRNSGKVSTTGNVIVSALGTLKGDGTVVANAVQNGGMVSPGNSPGVLHVQGDYSQTADGKLEIQLNGTTLGTGYDQLAVSGNMALNGALDITFGYTPHAGDSFDILDWGTRSGAFAAFNFPTLAGLRFDISQLYTTGGLTLLTKLPAGVLPGDFDQDGHVTMTDYGLWKVGFGISGVATHLQGDANGDGRVDAADYTMWRDELGQAGATGGSGAEATAAVPEPGTLLLTVVAMISLAFGVRGRRCSERFIAGR